MHNVYLYKALLSGQFARAIQIVAQARSGGWVKRDGERDEVLDDATSFSAGA
jgi:hypothetical protein